MAGGSAGKGGRYRPVNKKLWDEGMKRLFRICKKCGGQYMNGSVCWRCQRMQGERK